MNIYDRIPREILTELYENESNNNYVTSIGKKLDATFCHLQKIVCKLEQQKLLKSSVNGRKKILTLTKRGVEVVKWLKRIEEVCK